METVVFVSKEAKPVKNNPNKLIYHVTDNKGRKGTAFVDVALNVEVPGMNVSYDANYKSWTFSFPKDATPQAAPAPAPIPSAPQQAPQPQASQPQRATTITMTNKQFSWLVASLFAWTKGENVTTTELAKLAEIIEKGMNG